MVTESKLDIPEDLREIIAKGVEEAFSKMDFKDLDSLILGSYLELQEQFKNQQRREMKYGDVAPADLSEVIQAWRTHRGAETLEQEIHAKYEILRLLDAVRTE